MGYLFAGLLVLLIVGAGFTAFYLAARARGGERHHAAADPGFQTDAPGGGGAIAAVEKESPLGDTNEHAGEHREGRTVAEPGGRPPADAA